MKTPKRGRQFLVLTPEEKKAGYCVLAALALGLATQHYRATHPHSAPPPTAREQRAAKIATRTANARARSARGTPNHATAIPPAEAAEED